MPSSVAAPWSGPTGVANTATIAGPRAEMAGGVTAAVTGGTDGV